MPSNVIFVYLTNDKYNFLWDDFFALLLKYWPKFSFEVLINTESEKYNNSNFKIRKVDSYNRNSNWSDRLIHYLNRIDEEYIILWMDDHFIYDYIDNEKINKAIKIITENKKIGHISFESQPGSKESKIFEFLSRRKFLAPYRISLQPGVWEKKYLLKILRGFESPWQLEINGSFRSNFIKKDIYCFSQKVVYTHYGALIMRGKINKNISNYFKEYENLVMNYPLEEYTKVPESKKVFKRIFRLLRYGIDSCISIFRR